jgi:hypothetical protein
MRNLKASERWAVLVGLAAVTALGVVVIPFPPRFDRALHSAIGRALAKQALAFSNGGGQVTIITRDTEAFPQPAFDTLLGTLERDLAAGGAKIRAIRRIQADPLRALEAPSGDFFELIRRASPGHVIISLLGPPLLTVEQCRQLHPIKPKIVAFCPGSMGQAIDLRQLFEAGLLHAAIVTRPSPPETFNGDAKGAEAYDQQYAVMTASDRPRRQEAARPVQP